MWECKHFDRVGHHKMIANLKRTQPFRPLQLPPNGCKHCGCRAASTASTTAKWLRNLWESNHFDRPNHHKMIVKLAKIKPFRSIQQPRNDCKIGAHPTNSIVSNIKMIVKLTRIQSYRLLQPSQNGCKTVGRPTISVASTITKRVQTFREPNHFDRHHHHQMQ